jgi:transcription initiation factor TFIIE subunit alpha
VGWKIMLKDPIVQEILIDVTSDEKSSISIIECILKGITSDLEIVEETGLQLTMVRKVLYQLNDASIVSYKKAKDPETKYEIYMWKFEQDKVYELITKKYEDLLIKIEESIKFEEENMFFACNDNGHRYIFEKASEYNFVCPKCNDKLEYQDNTIVISELLKEKTACDRVISKGK